ncbi:hypothetical protein N9532_05605 [Amylibacter sp.]|nr:hypothetical protein [Amylibacter sp.]
MAINSTKLTLIVCTIDNEEVLSRHIGQLISVSSKVSYHVEILVVLGGDAVAPRFNSLPTNIIYNYLPEAEKGVYHAFNTGIDNAIGEFSYFANVGDRLTYLPLSLPQETDLISFPVTICDNHFNHIFTRYPNDAKYIVPHHQGVFLKTFLYRKFRFNTAYSSAADLDLLIQIKKENLSASHRDCEPPISLFTLGGISSSRNFYSIFSRKIQRFQIILRNRYVLLWFKFILARLFL